MCLSANSRQSEGKCLRGAVVAVCLIACALFNMGKVCADQPNVPHVEVRAGASAAENNRLRQELLAMAEEDQAARKRVIRTMAEYGVVFGEEPDLDQPEIKSAIEAGEQVDARNRARMAEIIDQFGWPGESLVCRDGAGAAWLLVQHADRDVAFQKKCLQLMQAAPDGEVSRQHVALLTDRVLVNQGLEQVYGTQMDGAFQPRPIKDAEQVDVRRASVGLPPLAEYIKQAKAAYQGMSRE